MSISNYNISDFFSYEFLRLNKDTILNYKNENFLILTIMFFIFSIVWTLLLGFAMPLLVFSGFVFGKWWGILLVLTSTTIGASLLYLLTGLFFRDIIQKKFAPKFSKLKKFFNQNELIYFMFFRFIGGGGTPFPIQNVLPVLFNMSVKNYIFATFFGIVPTTFVTTAL
ncbi:MAG: VTT domain-containing protein, partial [Candidatus Woesearchaeota archaeon]|nr:VTT domain-containing protein [Candidatus Woesearchaeota archaeon]